MQTRGFTLLELSIVLVIIGLLIGGVFAGQSLIHTAQLNAMVSEFNRYQMATQNFKQQYQALPGDMNNATAIWGSAGGTGSDTVCQAIASTTALTCNGNGDGVIGTSVSVNDERYRFWQHLANAKMIEGAYTGANAGVAPGVDVPASRFGANAGWYLQIASSYNGGSAYAFNTDYGTGHMLRLDNGSSTVTPKDAWIIDKKYDDGKPGMGNVLVYNWPSCTNAANQSDLTATYTLTVTTISCNLWFLASF